MSSHSETPPRTVALGASLIANGRALCSEEDVWCPNASLVVGWDVWRHPEVHYQLSPVCYCHWWRPSSPPPTTPIPVSRPFQIVGVDIMELPRTDSGNRYVLVFQDFLTKWPFAFPMTDQMSSRIAELLVKEVVPLFGVFRSPCSRTVEPISCHT